MAETQDHPVFACFSMLLRRALQYEEILRNGSTNLTFYIENIMWGDIVSVITNDGKDRCLFFRLILFM